MNINKKAIFAIVFFGGILLTSTILFALPTPEPELEKMEITTDEGFRVAFIGDQGIHQPAIDVLNLIKDEGADMVLHQGDLDYEDNPDAWDDMVSNVLGDDFPYFVSMGYHDQTKWDEYQEKIHDRLKKNPEIKCVGDLGVKSSCVYKDLFFVLVAPGVGTDELHGTVFFPEYESFVEEQLKNDDHIWQICSWSYNMNALQIGEKLDKTGWGVYETCKNHGAIIATAHEHSYHRTKTLIDIENQIVDPEWSYPDRLKVSEGSTFVFVSGIGGHSIRDQDRCLPYVYPYGCNEEWASIYTLDQGANFGSLFCTFNAGGQPHKAYCYFKNIDGIIIDEFTITNLSGDDDDTILEADMSGMDLTGKDFSNQILIDTNLSNTKFIDADLSHAILTGSTLTGTDFTNADLTGVTLSHKDLAKTILRGVNLTDANLFNVNLSGADLSGADMSGVDLTKLDISQTILKGTNLSGKDLTDNPITGSNLKSANLDHADLTGADLSGKDLTGANLSYADLRKVDLSNAKLANAKLISANLDMANLDGAMLVDADLTLANLTDATLQDADLSNAKLTEANLSYANLAGANLYHTHLTGANLSYANLAGVDLSEKYLTKTNLTGIDLSGKDLSETILTGANLSYANLTGVDLSGKDLTGTILTGANLLLTNLEGANLTNAYLDDAILTCVGHSVCN